MGRVFSLAMMLMAFVLVALPVKAEPQSQPPAATGVQKPVADIQGFRSAKFGMDEASVRKAIASDFGIKDDKIQREEHPTEKTTILAASVENLLPDSGSSVVTYVLGYRSKKLVQVNVIWPKGEDIPLGNTAIILRNYFLSMQFPPDSAVADAQLQDGSILAFRGTDQRGHMVAVLFQPTPKPKKDDKEQKPKNVASLHLSYVESPNKPDVFTLEPGKF